MAVPVNISDSAIIDGDDTHRPHYHLIFLGCPQDRHLIYDTWKYGNIDVGNIDNGAIRYVLDYINKDPIFSDSKYELFGDFEPPFYHYSKGLGFEEIENYINKGLVSLDGKIKFTENHTYTLSPYLKEKYGFVNDNRYFKDSVIRWSDVHHIPDLDIAQANRNEVVERSLVRSKVARGKPKLDLLKCQDNEAVDRLDRWHGFTDYDSIDSQIGLVV